MHERIRNAKEEGFTLIELLIVIIILGILAAIVVFAVGSTRKDSVAASCKTDYKQVQLSAEAVNTKVGTYPATAAGNDTTQAGVDTKYAALIAPASGALIKSDYPFNTNYRLIYAQTGSPAGASYTLVVSKADVGLTVVGVGATTPASATAADCDSL